MTDDKIELTARVTLHGISCFNVFQYLETVSGGDQALQNLLAAFETAIKSSWVAWLSEQATLACLTAKVIAPGPAVPADRVISSGNVGEVVGEALPANRVIVVTDYSEEYYKWGRGRHFYSGIPASSESDNCIDETEFLLVKTFATNLTQNIVSGVLGEWQRVVRSKLTGDDYPVETSSVRPQVATLRGRTTRLCG